MKTFGIVVASALFISHATHAQMLHKCIIDGKTVYQGTPCPSNAKQATTVESPNARPPNELDQSRARSRAAIENIRLDAAERGLASKPATLKTRPGEQKLLQDSHKREALERGEIVAGMSKDDIAYLLGTPTMVSMTERGGAATEQWIYRTVDPNCRERWNSVEVYVYFHGNAVASSSTNRWCSK